METYTIIGGQGVKLRVNVTGNPSGKPIVFIHGLSQCGLAWNKQTQSVLAEDFRLVAMDIRGHGASEKPRDAYGDSRLWADDVNAVITTLSLDRPILCGWSYAGVIISDYVRYFGEDNIAATVWVGATLRLGDSLVQTGFAGSGFLACLPGLLSINSDETIAALETFIRLCVHEPLLPEDFYRCFGYNAVVPPHVRLGLLSRDVNNDSVAAEMRKPMLLVCGEEDSIILPAMSDHIAGLAAHARISRYPNVGHAPFWEAPDRFNLELGALRRAM